MNVIFLDVDGVLNSMRFINKLKQHNISAYRSNLLDQDAMFNLGDIVAATGAYVVLSSSWRHSESCTKDVADQIKQYKAHIIGRTPTDVDHNHQDPEHHNWRGCEIRAYLDCHPEITNYVILDDDTDMLPEQQSHFVNTDFQDGLTHEDALKAIKILEDDSLRINLRN